MPSASLSLIDTVSFTDLGQGREILSRFSLPKSMKHSVGSAITRDRNYYVSFRKVSRNIAKSSYRFKKFLIEIINSIINVNLNLKYPQIIYGKFRIIEILTEKVLYFFQG